MRWVPPLNTRLSEQLEAVVSDLIALYADAETRLIRDTALAMNSGYALSGEIADLEAALLRLRQQARKTVRELHRLTPALVEVLVAEAAQHGLAYALTQLESLPVPFEITAEVPNSPAVLSLRSDLTNRLAEVSNRILRLPDDVYRAAISDTVASTLLLGGTHRRGHKAAWQKLLTNGITGFVDSAGRDWNLASYVEMASRTAAIRAYRQQTEDSLVANGIQLVSIIVGNDACNICGPWSGRVLSIDGTTGARRVRNPITGAMDLINVEYTLDMAREAGWGHPNCRCSEASYMPGLTTVVNSSSYHPDLEAERDRLRQLERRVRGIKRDEMTASTESSKAYYRERLRAAQAEIRAHVDKTGLKRKRYREQLDLGHKR